MCPQQKCIIYTDKKKMIAKARNLFFRILFAILKISALLEFGIYYWESWWTIRWRKKKKIQEKIKESNGWNGDMFVVWSFSDIQMDRSYVNTTET